MDRRRGVTRRGKSRAELLRSKREPSNEEDASASPSTAASSSEAMPESLIPAAQKVWHPSISVMIYGLMAIRVLSVALAPISDCDETFNYWEPLHYLLYGFGFQTWCAHQVYVQSLLGGEVYEHRRSMTPTSCFDHQRDACDTKWYGGGHSASPAIHCVGAVIAVAMFY